MGTTNTASNPFVQGLPTKNDLEEVDLPKEVLELFKAERFYLGKVPDVKPPLALIN